MGIQDRVIAVAEAELGYHEKASWDNLDDPTANPGSANYVKYSRDLAKLRYYNSSKKGVMWCDIFVDWCFCKAYGTTVGHRMLYQPLRSAGAGCASSRKYFIEHKALRDSPELGDQAFFWSRKTPGEVSHTGLVVGIKGGRIYTVEGNSDDKVQRHSYPMDYPRFAGFGRPDWSLAESEAQTGEDNMVPMIVTAENGGKVKIRCTPSTTGRWNTQLKVGTVVQAGEDIDGWRAVKYKDTQGYMLSEFLAPYTPPEDVTTSTDLSPVAPPAEPVTISLTLPKDAAQALLDALVNVLGVG